MGTWNKRLSSVLFTALLLVSCAGSSEKKIIRVPAMTPPVYTEAFHTCVSSLKRKLPGSIKKNHIILSSLRNRTARHLDTGVMTTLLLGELVAKKFNVSRERKGSPGGMDKLPLPCNSLFYLGGSLQEVKKSIVVDKEGRRKFHRYTLLTLTLEEGCTRRVAWIKTITFLEILPAEPKITF